MKTPLIFKLLLVIAVGLRLIKANDKTPEIKDVEDYLNLDLFRSQKLPFQPTKSSSLEQVKMLYRTEVRPIPDSEKSKEMWILSISHSIIHTFKKGNIFRFIWHKNEWVLAFYQTLSRLEMRKEAELFHQAILEHCGNSLDSNTHDFFPDASIDSPALKEFNKLFDLETYAEKVLQTISKS